MSFYGSAFPFAGRIGEPLCPSPSLRRQEGYMFLLFEGINILVAKKPRMRQTFLWAVGSLGCVGLAEGARGKDRTSFESQSKPG